MGAQTHDNATFHRGLVPDDQLASGTPASGDVPMSNGDGTRTWASPGGPGAAVPGTIVAGFDGAGSVPDTGKTASVAVPSAGTLTAWRVLTDNASATATIGVKVGATNPPSVSITGGADPTASGQDHADSTLAGWTTAFSEGDVFLFTLSAVTGATNVVIELTYTRS